MNKKIIAERLRLLRDERGLTQKQVAQSTNIPLRSIINYENALREPAAENMVKLEQFYQVSGEYILGRIDRETFNSNCDAISNDLDELISLFVNFKTNFSHASQANQIQALDVLTAVMEDVTSYYLRADGEVVPSADAVTAFRAMLRFNGAGRAELLKRIDEMRELPRYNN